MDAELGPANQVQGPMVLNQAQGLAIQNPAQGPADQNPGQVPAGQFPAQGPVQIVQNVPVKPLQQLVPMQPSPAGHCNSHSSDFLSKLNREETRIFR